MYILNLAEDKRVLSCGEAQEGVNYIDPVFAETAPDTSDGQWTEDYIYDEATEGYIYDPVPRPEPIEPEPEPEYVTYDELAAAIREGVNSYGQ